MSAAELLQQIANEVRTCTACRLHQSAMRAVPGEGPPDAKVMFIGEAPGFHEDRQGRPFVGAAGQFLEELLALAGLRRSDVFIANVIKHRPPDNRDQAGRNCCVQSISRTADCCAESAGDCDAWALLDGALVSREKISRIHGQPRWIDGRLIVPMMHPAAALHQPQYRALIEADFRRLPEFIAQAEARSVHSAAPAAPEKPDDPDVQQLSLF